MIGGVKLTGHESGYETAERGTDLVTACGEPLTYKGDYTSLYAGKRGRKLDEGYVAVGAALHLVLIMPCDPEKVGRVYIPQSDFLEPFDYLRWHKIRIAHLSECRYYNAVFTSSLDRTVEALLMNG